MRMKMRPTLRYLKRVLRPNWVRILFLYQTELITSHLEHLSRDWTSPIYIFFKKDIQVEHADGCHFHEFQCTAGKCRGKNGQSVCWFLDTSDAKSMSGLCQHAKKCWGDEAVGTADGTWDLDSVRLVLAKTKLHDRSITAQLNVLQVWKGRSPFHIVSILQQKLGKILTHL